MSSFKNLAAYQMAFDLAMKIFEVSRLFPKEERYSLTDQVRRSSRSVCSNIGEGYRKRHYHKHFIAKISDADMENSETSVWLDFAMACGYLDRSAHQELHDQNADIGRLLGFMLKNPSKFLSSS